MAKTRKPKLSSYQKKLLDPLWQRKRLEAFDAAEWTCSWCGARRDSLHVHHGYYRKAADPWDYSSEYLHVLCHRCHEKAESERGELYRIIGMIPPGRIYDLIFTVADYAAKVLPEKAAERAAAPSEPEPECDPSLKDEMTEEAWAAWFAEMKEILK